MRVVFTIIRQHTYFIGVHVGANTPIPSHLGTTMFGRLLIAQIIYLSFGIAYAL